jgi:hypothetical protein
MFADFYVAVLGDDVEDVHGFGHDALPSTIA